MSFLIQGPYPLMQSTLLMPSPREGNQKNLACTVQTMRSMNGTVYTFVKDKRGRRVWQWDFVGTKEKGREAIEFVRRYSGGLVRATDDDANTILGYITINPMEVEGLGRAAGWPSSEAARWTISIEEKV